MNWFLGMLGLSALLALVGRLLRPRRRKREYDTDTYYQQMAENCIYNAEHVYCRK